MDTTTTTNEMTPTLNASRMSVLDAACAAANASNAARLYHAARRADVFSKTTHSLGRYVEEILNTADGTIQWAIRNADDVVGAGGNQQETVLIEMARLLAMRAASSFGEEEEDYRNLAQVLDSLFLAMLPKA